MRCKYKRFIENNHRLVESWYEAKMEEIYRHLHSCDQETESKNQQVTELRYEYQNLETELQAQLSMIQCLQFFLNDTECHNNMQLQQIRA